MMPLRRRLALTLAAGALLMAGLACQTLLDPDAFFNNFEENRAAAPGASSGDPLKLQPSPTPTPTPQPLSLRLNGAELPNLSFDPPGESPRNANRPQLSGPARTLDTRHFRIHYTLGGEDAVPELDDNANRHPDYVEEVARALEYSWFALVDHFGWAPPPPDGGLGGDERYDVYLENIFESDGTAGYAEGGLDGDFVGDNPNSLIQETHSSHSYLAVDNDYSDYETSDGVGPIEFMRTTVVHEFLHAVQYGYDGLEPHDWLWEASANWIQDEVFDDYNDANQDLPAVFKAPDSCLLAYGGEARAEDENHWYGLWILIRYYSERYGHEAVRALWETAASRDGYDVWDSQLAGRGTNLETLFQDFAVALLLRDFEEGSTYPTVRLEGAAPIGERFTPTDGVAQLAADFVQIPAREPITLRLNSSGLQGVLVGLSAGQASLFPLSDGQASLDATNFDSLYLIVLNLNRAAEEGHCAFTPYDLLVEAGGVPQRPANQLPAPNFIPPKAETFFELPPDLALVYLPSGYHFSEAYELSREEFYHQDYIDWYVPGAGPVTVVDYYNPDKEDYISLYASNSPHASLEAFLDAMSHQPLPGELRTLAGVDVLVEDWGDEQGNYSSATFVLDGLFIVIEGGVSPATIEQIAGSFIDA